MVFKYSTDALVWYSNSTSPFPCSSRGSAREGDEDETSNGHFCKASDTRKVERIQERALRIVYNSHSETYTNLLDRAKLPSLLNRRLQDIVILMYKVKYRLVPDFICDIFSTKSCKYNFRNQNFDIPRFNSVLYGKHSLRYLGPFLWNKLDKNISEMRISY